jgi:hypothetical protein
VLCTSYTILYFNEYHTAYRNVPNLLRFVVIAMEAMDQLLVACHAQTLNLFVESFLKMVQKLLESTDPQLQILATQSVSAIQGPPRRKRESSTF